MNEELEGAPLLHLQGRDDRQDAGDTPLPAVASSPVDVRTAAPVPKRAGGGGHRAQSAGVSWVYATRFRAWTQVRRWGPAERLQGIGRIRALCDAASERQ